MIPRMSEPAAVTAVNLSKVYAGGIRAVDGVNLVIKPEEVFGLLGPNGAGKTTFIRMLTTLLRSTEGKLEVFGRDTRSNPSGVRECIGYVSQEVALDKVMTGREHLELHAALYHVPANEIGERIAEVLELVDLEERADDRVGEYSGGMKKRLEIACGLMHAPRLLILDEPTLGLDIHVVSILMTTHYLDEADTLCDRVAIIDRGRIQACGPPDELKAQLGGDVVTVKLVGIEAEDDGLGLPTRTDHLADYLRDVQGVRDVKSAGNGTIHVSVNKDGTIVARLIDSVREKGHLIENISYARPSLDDVFFDYLRFDREFSVARWQEHLGADVASPPPDFVTPMLEFCRHTDWGRRPAREKVPA